MHSTRSRHNARCVIEQIACVGQLDTYMQLDQWTKQPGLGVSTLGWQRCGAALKEFGIWTMCAAEDIQPSKLTAAAA